MDEIDKVIHSYTDHNPHEAKAMYKQEQVLNASVAVTKLQHHLGLSQIAFSKKIGVPHSTISRIENGDVDPSGKLLKKIAKKTHRQIQFRFVHLD